MAPEHRKPFLNGLIDLLDHSGDVLSAPNASMLKNVLKAGRSLESLDFIEGYPPHLLIDDFSTFYMSRIAIFKYATHVLDMEESIRDQFQRTPLTSGGQPVIHYRFPARVLSSTRFAFVVVRYCLRRAGPRRPCPFSL